jgi:glycosyltransferase involved in cell wall biosynthesis
MVVHSDFPHDVRVAREVRAAIDDGLDVYVVATRRPGELRREIIDGADVHRLAISHRRGAGALGVFAEYVAFALLAALRVGRLSLRRRFDVVQVHNPPDFLIGAALLPKLLGARIVFDVHDLSSDMFAMRFPSAWWTPAVERGLRAIERVACRAADVVVTVHEPYRLELIRRGAAADKTLVVLNTVDETLLPRPPRRPTRTPFRIVYHGSVTPHYGVELLVRALAEVIERVPEARLEIYGEGDAVRQLAAEAAALGVATRLTMTGELLPHVEVLRHVDGASVGVIPNLPTRLNQFALSTKLFEYVALGVPVLSADLPTIRDHFSDSEITYFRAGDAHSLADAIVAIAGDFEEALRRAAAAKHRYEASYGWEVQAKSYATALRRLAAQRDRRRRS